MISICSFYGNFTIVTYLYMPGTSRLHFFMQYKISLHHFVNPFSQHFQLNTWVLFHFKLIFSHTHTHIHKQSKQRTRREKLKILFDTLTKYLMTLFCKTCWGILNARNMTDKFINHFRYTTGAREKEKKVARGRMLNEQ